MSRGAPCLLPLLLGGGREVHRGRAEEELGEPHTLACLFPAKQSTLPRGSMIMWPNYELVALGRDGESEQREKRTVVRTFQDSGRCPYSWGYQESNFSSTISALNPNNILLQSAPLY